MEGLFCFKGLAGAYLKKHMEIATINLIGIHKGK